MFSTLTPDRAAHLLLLAARNVGTLRGLGDVPGHEFHGNQYVDGQVSTTKVLEWSSYEDNPQRKNIADLIADIRKHGVKEPLTVYVGDVKDGGAPQLQDGHHRLRAALELGLKTVPVRFAKTFEALAANRNHTPLHVAADKHVPKISVAVRYAFAMGRRALGKDANVGAAVAAIKKALEDVLPGTLSKALADGGEAGVAMLARLKVAGDVEGHEFHGNQWTDGLSGANREAVLTQLRDPSFVNGTLRGNHQLSQEQQAHVEALDKAIQQAPALTKETTLYRAISQQSLTEGHASGLASEGINPGSTFTDKGYVSTTMDRKVANDPGYVHPNDRAVLHITAPAGTHALEPAHVVVGHEKASSLAGWEHEVLLPRNSTFHIDKVAGRNIHVTLVKARGASEFVTLGDWSMRTLKPSIIKPTVVSPIKMRFDANNEAASKWAREHAAELIDGIATTTEQAIKDAVARAQEEGGLREHYDEILAAVGDEARADLIARTEAMTAANEGQRQAWDQAVGEGLLTGDEQAEWIATSDACPECEALDGELRPLDGEYPHDGGDGPPLHPNCRCTEGISAR